MLAVAAAALRSDAPPTEQARHLALVLAPPAAPAVVGSAPPNLGCSWTVDAATGALVSQWGVGARS